MKVPNLIETSVNNSANDAESSIVVLDTKDDSLESSELERSIGGILVRHVVFYQLLIVSPSRHMLCSCLSFNAGPAIPDAQPMPGRVLDSESSSTTSCSILDHAL